MLNVKKLLTKILTALEPQAATPVTGIAVYKIGSIVCMRINIANKAYSTGWNTLGTLPALYRPPTRVDFWAIDNTTTLGTAAPCLISIDPTSGNVRFYKYASNSTNNIQLMGNITYTLGGGYCIALFSMLSAIERWWEHAKHQEALHQNTYTACKLQSSEQYRPALCKWSGWLQSEHGEWAQPVLICWQVRRINKLCAIHSGWSRQGVHQVQCEQKRLTSERGWAVC